MLAIEADGAAYHSGHVARERDRLRLRLLESREWTFHRIWSTDWFNDADTEVAHAVAAFEAALAGEDDALEENERSKSAPGEGRPAEDVPASWHITDDRRTAPRPSLALGMTIDKYDPADLVRLVRYVRSDGILRTRDEELLVLMRELGFVKRGQRIATALSTVQDAIR